jgi:hypothetical protein
MPGFLRRLVVGGGPYRPPHEDACRLIASLERDEVHAILQVTY